MRSLGAAILNFIIFACHNFRMAKTVNIRDAPEQKFFVRPEPDRNLTGTGILKPNPTGT